MKFLIGFFLIACGVGLIRYRYKIYHFTGDWGWAQRFFGGNGTVTAIILIGMFFIALGSAYPFGVFENLSNPSKELITPGFGQ